MKTKFKPGQRMSLLACLVALGLGVLDSATRPEPNPISTFALWSVSAASVLRAEPVPHVIAPFKDILEEPDIFLSGDGDEPELVDAVSREFTIYNNTTGGEVEFTDAVSREFTVYKDSTGSEVELTDAVSREFTAYRGSTDGEVELTDAVTREFTVYKGSTDGEVEFADTVSREFTAFATRTVLVGDAGTLTFKDTYSNDNITLINVGTYLRWNWITGNHTTTSYNNLWHAPVNNQNPNFTRQFNQIGSFPYFSAPHETEGMTGIVHVRRIGDTNLDGCVNDVDLLNVLFNFGESGPSFYDLNYNGLVDDDDLLLVLFNFGNGC